MKIPLYVIVIALFILRLIGAIDWSWWIVGPPFVGVVMVAAIFVVQTAFAPPKSDLQRRVDDVTSNLKTK